MPNRPSRSFLAALPAAFALAALALLSPGRASAAAPPGTCDFRSPAGCRPPLEEAGDGVALPPRPDPAPEEEGGPREGPTVRGGFLASPSGEDAVPGRPRLN